MLPAEAPATAAVAEAVQVNRMCCTVQLQHDSSDGLYGIVLVVDLSHADGH